MSKIMFGSDPEFFVVNEDNVCIPPALLRLKYDVKTFGVSDPGPVDDPSFNRHPVFYKDDEVTVIEDGAALELNIKPSTDYAEIHNRIIKGFEAAKIIVKPLGLKISTRPTVRFDNNLIFIEGAIDPYLQWCTRFGCDPDYDAYDDKSSEDVDASNVDKRYAGGHLHISGIPHNLAKPFIKLLDIFVGNTCIAYSPYPMEELERQKHYGRPGKYRLPKYGDIEGIEYRTPSVSWVTHVATIYRVINMATFAYNTLQNASVGIGILKNFSDRAKNNILSCNVEEAKALYSKLVNKGVA